jgi:glycosyltransferase involved in cell wall biosynthesis
MNIFVVIAAYNEAKSVGTVVAEVKNCGYNVVVVNDGSGDDTAKIAAAAGATVLSHAINRGQGAALQTGITYALSRGAQIIVTFDADGQFEAKEIEGVVKPLLLGVADVVLGSRFLKKENSVPKEKLFILKFATAVTNYYTGLKLTDIHNGFRAFSQKAALALEIRQDGMAHASEILEQIKKHDFIYREVPVTVKYTDYSRAKGQKITNSFRIIFDLLISRLTR